MHCHASHVRRLHVCVLVMPAMHVRALVVPAMHVRALVVPAMHVYALVGPPSGGESNVEPQWQWQPTGPPGAWQATLPRALAIALPAPRCLASPTCSQGSQCGLNDKAGGLHCAFV